MRRSFRNTRRSEAQPSPCLPPGCVPDPTRRAGASCLVGSPQTRFGRRLLRRDARSDWCDSRPLQPAIHSCLRTHIQAAPPPRRPPSASWAASPQHSTADLLQRQHRSQESDCKDHRDIRRLPMLRHSATSLGPALDRGRRADTRFPADVPRPDPRPAKRSWCRFQHPSGETPFEPPKAPSLLGSGPPRQRKRAPEEH